jgi:putative glutamine transport system substrate-binding protein
MKSRFQVVMKSILAASAFALVAGVSATNEIHADNVKNDTYKRIMKTDRMNWGVKGDTKLMGLMNIKTGKLEGFDVEMAKEITKRVNPDAKVVYTQITSGTRVPMLINGNIDAIIATMSVTPDRQKVVDFSQPYFNAGQSILVKKSSKYHNVKELNTPKARVLAVQGSTSIALTALKAGQGDALTTDNGILYGMAAGSKSLEVRGGTFTKEPYGVAMQKQNPKLVKAVDKAIDDIKQDGTYEKMAKKWFGDVKGMDWKELAGE